MHDEKFALGASGRGFVKSVSWFRALAMIGVVFVVSPFQLGCSRGSHEATFIRSFTPGSPVTGGYVGWVGAKITVGPQPIVVTSLGRIANASNSRQHTLKIVNVATGDMVPGASAEISMAGQTAGKFVYGTFPGPVTLAAGASYYLLSSESLGNNVGDFFNDYNSKVVTVDVAQVEHAIYREGNEWRALGSKNEMFGPIDFRYKP